VRHAEDNHDDDYDREAREEDRKDLLHRVHEERFLRLGMMSVMLLMMLHNK